LTSSGSGPTALPGVLGVVHPAILQGAAQYSQGDPARLVGDDVGLQLGHRPDIIKDVLDQVGVRSVLSVVRHDFFPFFFVSKKRATRNYSYVNDGDPDDFYYNLQLMDLWSIKFGS